MSAPRVCRIEGCDRPRYRQHSLCVLHESRKGRLGDPEAPLLGSSNGHESYWPTDDRRPHESVSEWCRRLDAYYNAPGAAS